MMRWPVFIGTSAFFLLLVMPVAISARQRLTLPAIEVIVPAGLVRGKESRDILYDRAINFMLARYPECSRLQASLAFTPPADYGGVEGAMPEHGANRDLKTRAGCGS